MWQFLEGILWISVVRTFQYIFIYRCLFWKIKRRGLYPKDAPFICWSPAVDAASVDSWHSLLDARKPSNRLKRHMVRVDKLIHQSLESHLEGDAGSAVLWFKGYRHSFVLCNAVMPCWEYCVLTTVWYEHGDFHSSLVRHDGNKALKNRREAGNSWRIFSVFVGKALLSSWFHLRNANISTELCAFQWSATLTSTWLGKWSIFRTMKWGFFWGLATERRTPLTVSQLLPRCHGNNLVAPLGGWGWGG